MGNPGYKPPILDRSPVATMKKAGAPTKYKPEYCDLMLQRAIDGLDTHVLDFCIYIGVVKSSLQLWKKEYPRFSASYREARQIYERRFRKILEAQMTGELQGSTPAAIFYLKAQHSWTEDPFDEDNDENNELTIEVTK